MPLEEDPQDLAQRRTALGSGADGSMGTWQPPLGMKSGRSGVLGPGRAGVGSCSLASQESPPECLATSFIHDASLQLGCCPSCLGAAGPESAQGAKHRYGDCLDGTSRGPWRGGGGRGQEGRAGLEPEGPVEGGDRRVGRAGALCKNCGFVRVTRGMAVQC